MSENLLLRFIITPRELNTRGTMFGGSMLYYFDLAAPQLALDVAGGPVALVAVNNVVFKAPIWPNDRVNIYGTITKTGTTSITIYLEAYRQDLVNKGTEEFAASGEMVFVAIDGEHKPKAIKK